MKISYCENIYGSYRQPKLKGKEGKFTLHAFVEIESVRNFFMSKIAKMSGTVEAEGIAKCSCVTGSMIIDPVIRSEIVYEFDFSCDRGENYTFTGKKLLRLLNPVISLTRVEGKLLKEGKYFADVELRSHFLELSRVLSSITISFR